MLTSHFAGFLIRCSNFRSTEFNGKFHEQQHPPNKERAKKEGKRLGRPKGSRDKTKRSISGYHLRYAGVKKDDRKLGERDKREK